MDEPHFDRLPDQPHDDADPGAEMSGADAATSPDVISVPAAPPPVDASGAVDTGQPDPAQETVVFEDLTLADALAFLIYRPAETSRLLWQVLRRDPDERAPVPGTVRVVPVDDVPVDGDLHHPDSVAGDDARELRETEAEPARRATLPDAPAAPAVSPVASAAPQAVAAPWGALDRERWLWIGVLLLSIVVAAAGGSLLHGAATDPAQRLESDTNGAQYWLVLAGALAGGAELYRQRRTWAARFPRTARQIHVRLRRNDLHGLWAAMLGTGAIVALLAGTAGLGGAVGFVLLLMLALGLWLVALAGLTPSSAIPSDTDTAGSRSPADALTGDPVVAGVRPPAIDTPSPALRWLEANIVRVLLVPVALLFSAVAYTENVRRNTLGQVIDVEFHTAGFLAWIASIVLWIVILGVDVRTLPGWLQRWRLWAGWRQRLKLSVPLVVLLGVMLVAVVFRFADFSSTPPEMTSDHIEKLLDAVKVDNGFRGVFFPNNGGREGFQMYVVAFLANLPGGDFSFETLKLATVIEGLLTLPALVWMSVQIFGTTTEADRRRGLWVGLALAGLVAASYWHQMLSRLGLRIVLTPLTTALVIGFLARAMRHQRMRDYLALGLMLGVGVYFYQANRMLPLIVVAGVGLALLETVRSRGDLLRVTGDAVGLGVIAAAPLLVYMYTANVLAESGYANTRDLGEQLGEVMALFAMVWLAILALLARARPSNRALYAGGGLLATVVVALALYIPMYHYSQLYPDQFWNRTRGRLFGEQAFVRFNPASGAAESYEPSLSEQIERFWDERAVVADNFRDALRMFHWKGDVQWINNANLYPSLDAVAGGLVAVGAALWLVTLLRRRDAVWGLLPVAGVIMLLPSVLAVAFPNENPSFTRASGTLPIIYWIAALPVGLVAAELARQPLRIGARTVRGVGGALLISAVIALSIGPQWDAYFTDYRLQYAYSWRPYSEIAQPLEDFATGEGSYGNAFMVAYPHWLDHRILGTAAGDIRWPNGLVTRDQLDTVVASNVGTAYEYDPALPLFVMFNVNDSETRQWLQTRYPGGTLALYEYAYDTDRGLQSGSFYIYTVFAGRIGD